MKELDPDQLKSVVGGAGDYMENIRDKNGGIVDTVSGWYKHLTESSKNAAQKFNEHMDRVQAPWTFFNGIFGGARGPRPTVPTPPRPRY